MEKAARTLALCLALAAMPGCLAAAAGGLFYAKGKGKEAAAQREQARLDYVQKRRAAGATDDQILSEIKATDPDWYEEIEESGGGLGGPKPEAARPSQPR